MPHLGVSFPESLGMALDEQQKLLNSGEKMRRNSILMRKCIKDESMIESIDYQIR